MKYLIFGDSWGCGEWHKNIVYADHAPDARYVPANEPRKYWSSEIIAGTDVGTYLKELGHDAVNISKGGDSNLNQLRDLEQHLKTNNDYDRIIWFFTEPMRDILNNNIELDVKFISRNTYQNLIRDWNYHSFYQADRIYQNYQIPFILIGGMEPVQAPRDFEFCLGCLSDWTNTLILDKPVDHPYNAGKFRNLVEFENINFDLEFVNEELKRCQSWIEMCYSNPHFPDYGHPDRHCHKQLAQWLNDLEE